MKIHPRLTKTIASYREMCHIIFPLQKKKFFANDREQNPQDIKLSLKKLISFNKSNDEKTNYFLEIVII